MNATAQERRNHPVASAGDVVEAPSLVVGDDGSAGADLAWQWVLAQGWPGWRISVVTARPPDLPGSAMDGAVPRPWDSPHPRLLDVAPDGGPCRRVEHLLVEADPRLVLDAFDDAALVVVGARGGGALKRMGIGSTAEWLCRIHRPLAPVVVARSSEPTRRVLLCVDGSQHARRAVDAVLSMPWLERCEVLVLGVEDGPGLAGPAVQDAAERVRRRGAAMVEARVVPGRRHGLPGDARSVVVETVDAERPDLVAVGARGAGGVRGLLMGSVTQTVLHRTACSVLVAKVGDVVG